MLCEMIVKVPSIHEVENETKLVRRLKGIVEIDDKGTVVHLG